MWRFISSVVYRRVGEKLKGGILMNNDTVKITFVDGTQRVISNTNYNNFRGYILANENFEVKRRDGKLPVVYVVANILTVEKEGIFSE